MWTEESKREFDQNMLLERDWRLRQFAAEDRRDYEHAKFCHKMRWRCMDAAIDALKPIAEQAN